ncbi:MULTISPECIES: DUF2599 domain-containing protein [unclassified Nosocomiicoccus]|uniref:DUF2599 domain-containing protein n=1 Tax=unclassified Nosocomiicoccus TaxID=2646683 RepID=UPI0008BA0014|nr:MULTISPECIES: DUF2599 domain-containing protein [unclassified Nosocomiicoccus]OFL49592.1 hypothetical protein HMPREF2767_05790 [Nosocomiicoccus sp. HMSC067E10]OFO55259.1 hypothetical protein HMPREF3029_00135 [Nosocomiicoccus sp. HMSC059G07]OFS63598.1 hypothetical protein HMPREF3177_02725 [Nosocomiicoccus sp. HMSC09A07]
MKKILLIFSILVSSYIFLEVQNAKASVDELGYQVEYKTAENIDFDKSDVFVVLIEENRLDINKSIYAVYERKEIEKFENDSFNTLGEDEGFTTYSAKKPPTNFSNYYSSGSWITRSGKISLSLYPKNIAYAKPSNAIVRAHYVKYRWDTVYNKYKNNSRWKNTASMKAQLNCHADYAKGLKTPWNLEPWRKQTNYAIVLRHSCNAPN